MLFLAVITRLSYMKSYSYLWLADFSANKASILRFYATLIAFSQTIGYFIPQKKACRRSFAKRFSFYFVLQEKALQHCFDRTNRSKNIQHRMKTRKDKSRRYQDYDGNAPVSGRQRKKRKERKESQSDNITENGIIVSAPTHA